jgi:kynurenine formamidase
VSSDNWGRWGDDDERGALNLLTPETVLAATQCCRTGSVYQLGLPIQRTGIPTLDFRGAPQRLTLTNASDERMFDSFGAVPGVGTNEDLIVFPSHTSTHMDALCHVYAGQKMYNGHPHDAMQAYAGATRCGIERAGGFAARGVLIDIAGHQGCDALPAGHVVTGAELEAALDAQGVALHAGDVALVRTGWVEWCLAEAGGAMSFEQPGLGLDAARWLAERDIVAVGADNSAVEAMPFDGGVYLTVHIELLVKRGIHLIEHLRLGDLARDHCHEFLFTVGPLLVTGATASPVNPIAIG